MVDGIEVVVYDREGLKDTYLIKPIEVKQQEFDIVDYYKRYKYEQPKQNFDEMFDQENDISYNPEYFRENLGL